MLRMGAHGFWTVLGLGASLAHLWRDSLLHKLLMLVHIDCTSPLVKMDQNHLMNMHNLNVLTVMVSCSGGLDIYHRLFSSGLSESMTTLMLRLWRQYHAEGEGLAPQWG